MHKDQQNLGSGRRGARCPRLPAEGEMGPNREAMTRVIEKPLSWGAENRQDLARRTYSEGSPGRGKNIDNGKDTGHTYLFSWRGGYVKGSNGR